VLRRVHRYPIVVQASRLRLETPVPNLVNETPVQNLVKRLVALADGSRCMDQICSEIDIAHATCDAELTTLGYLTVNIYR
jgi:hypothetical protein